MADEISIVVRAEDQFSNVLGNFGNIMTGIKSAIDLAGSALRTFGGFAQEGLTAIASYERLSASLTSLTASQILQAGAAETMTQAMTMAAPKAEELLNWVQQLAIKSPFTQEGVAQAFRMAEAYGFSADESKRLVQALIDFAAGTGASEDSMRRITLALGQISATGKVTGGDMLQLVNAGLPVTQILADGFGVTTAKIMEMRSQGLLPATESIEYITQYLETNFKGAAEAQANTWAGLLGTFEDLKQMGLREFFGGMFDVLQPLAVELSDFIQTEGMDKLGEWGEKLGSITKVFVDLAIALSGINGGKLYDLGASLQSIAGTDSIFYALGTAIRVFQQAIDDGASSREAFIAGLTKFTDLTGIEITPESFSAFLDKLDGQLAIAINNYDWTKAGDSFGKIIVNAMQGGIESNGSLAIPAIGKAISSWFLGAAGVADWTEFRNTFTGIIRQFVLEPIGNWIHDNWWKIILPMVPSLSPQQKLYITNSISGIINDIQQGFSNGLSSIGLTGWVDWWTDHVINPVKKLLGISSPSTVFMQIGKDLIQGLINGIQSMLGAVTGVIKNILAKLLDPLKPILDFLGIDFSDILGTSSTGTTGGGTSNWPGNGGSTGGGTNPGTGGTSGVVNYNFYGPVYMSGVPAEGTYDCPPNPIIQTGANQLVTPGY